MPNNVVPASPHLLAMMDASLRPRQGVPPGVVSLRSGEPYVDAPAPIIERLIDALRVGSTHYAPPGGLMELRHAVAATVVTRYGTPLSAENVVITHGGTGALSAAVLSVVGPGDRVVIPTPTYSVFADLVHLAGGTPVFVRPAPGFELDLGALEREMRGAVAVILCNPCNPTGVVYKPGVVAEVMRIARKHDAVLISDEAYARLVYDPSGFASVLELADLDDNLIYCQTFSKEYAMTGLRVGYLVSGARRVTMAQQISSTLDSAINTSVQKAALAALELDDAWCDSILRDYGRNKEVIEARLRGVGGLEIVESGSAFYSFVGLGEGADSARFVRRAFEAGVAVRDGAEFGPGGEGYIRISYSVSPDELAEGLDRLEGVWSNR